MEKEDARTRFKADDWVELYGDYLYRFALMRLRDPMAAEDAVQETFLAALKNLDSFDGRVDIKYWLRGILKNKTVDHIRKSVRKRELETDKQEDVAQSLLYKLTGIPSTRPKPWAFDPDSAFAQEEFWDAFRSCMDKLNDPLRQAFQLKMLDEMSTEEICKDLEIQPNNLWVMLHRARGKLKDCLEHQWVSP